MENTQGLAHRVAFAGLIYFALTLPFQFGFLPVAGAFAFFLFSWIGEKRYKTMGRELKSGPWFFLLIFIAWELISLLWADPWTKAGQAVNRLLPILLFIWLLMGKKFSSKEWRIVWYVFSFSMLASMIAALAMGVPRYLETGDTSQFYYMKLSRFLERQPHYIALYAASALAFLCLEFFRLIKTHKSKAYSVLIPAALLLLYVFLLSARAQVFALIGVTVMAILYLFYRKKQVLKGVLWSALAVAVLALGLMGSPKARERFEESVKQGDLFVDETGGGDPRVITWKLALKTIWQSPIIGHGIGAANLKLIENAKETQGAEIVVERRLNFHNQYLQILGNTGIIGLALFLVWGFVLLRFGFQTEHWLFVLTLALMAISFLTESMLLRMAGARFLVFLLASMLCLIPDSKPASPDEK